MQRCKHYRSIFFNLLIVVFLFTYCNKTTPHNYISTKNSYTISNQTILSNNKPIQLIGTNAFHVFGAGSFDMIPWNIDIVREFIGNVKESPISENVVKDSQNSYLYPLQTIVDSNRTNQKITIICPFGWDGTNTTMFSGTSPSKTSWWGLYKIKLSQWAVQFKDQPDVWIELWNEPYIYNRTDGYTDAVWLQDMNELVNIIRSVGNNNIILVPVAEQGQDESVLINQGQPFLQGKSNILFDIHAYEKWLLDNNQNISTRLNALWQKNIPIFFGEIAPMNASVLMNPSPMLDSIYNHSLSVCAWTWKYDDSDQDALLNAKKEVNNVNNNNWGTVFKTLLGRTRK